MSAAPMLEGLRTTIGHRVSTGENPAQSIWYISGDATSVDALSHLAIIADVGVEVRLIDAS
jgi:hypothetical protein